MLVSICPVGVGLSFQVNGSMGVSGCMGECGEVAWGLGRNLRNPLTCTQAPKLVCTHTLVGFWVLQGGCLGVAGWVWWFAGYHTTLHPPPKPTQHPHMYVCYVCIFQKSFIYWANHDKLWLDLAEQIIISRRGHILSGSRLHKMTPMVKTKKFVPPRDTLFSHFLSCFIQKQTPLAKIYYSYYYYYYYYYYYHTTTPRGACRRKVRFSRYTAIPRNIAACSYLSRKVKAV